VGTEPFPKTKGSVALASPRLDVPVKNARWELYLPPDYDYSRFKGSMTHEEDAAPAVQVYSSAEYFKQEKKNRVERQSEVSRAISNVKSQLALGNYRVANEDFNQALGLNTFVVQDEQARKELEELKLDLGRAQRSNLIEAQRQYTFDNVGKLAGKGMPQPEQQQKQQAEQAAQMVQYDEAAVDRQILAIQKGQEIVATRVQPLRANLPTRGARHAFSQVLQTEVNKPMTIQFTAASAKETGWFTWLVYLAGGFLLLWGIAAALLTRKKAAHH